MQADDLVETRHDMSLRFCIADPPYLGRAVRWYGHGGCGDGYGLGQADNHPNAADWDDPQRHQQLVKDLDRDFDGWAIAMSVHSLSTYLQVLETDSRNGIRVAVWHKPSSLTSGARVCNRWEPVLLRIPKSRRGRTVGKSCSDVFQSVPARNGFRGAKPHGWTLWILEMLGVQPHDEVIDMFHGSGAVSESLAAMGMSSEELP